jgi:hypothetical protein
MHRRARPARDFLSNDTRDMEVVRFCAADRDARLLMQIKVGRDNAPPFDLSSIRRQ